jgi:hypothetical protein
LPDHPIANALRQLCASNCRWLYRVGVIGSVVEQRPKLKNLECATPCLLLYDVIDDRHRAFSGLLVGGIEAMPLEARVIYGEHQTWWL